MKLNITPHVVANEVRMMRTEHLGSILVVEGPTDKTFYQAVIDKAHCKVVIAHGKSNAIEAISILQDSGTDGVIAIIDSDFNRVGVQQPPSSQNIFLTDLHDVECMMIVSPAFAKVLSEFARADRVGVFSKRVGCDVSVSLARNAMTIGYLRWASAQKGWPFRFEDLRFSKFVDLDNLTIDHARLIREIKDHSQQHGINAAVILDTLKNLQDEHHDPLQVSCGHDILELLSLGLRRVFVARKESEVKREVLERSLRLAYEASFFKQTKLYIGIRTWEAANSRYRVLPEEESG